jgi:hypothetical protein
MPIESEVMVPPVPSSDYPKLMKHIKLNFIVLFSKPNEGTVVFREGEVPYIIGEHSKHWALTEFEDTIEEVVLRNV